MNATSSKTTIYFIPFVRTLANKCNFTVTNPADLPSKRVEFYLESEWYFDSVNNGYIIKPKETMDNKVQIEDYYSNDNGEIILELEVRLIKTGCNLEYYHEYDMVGEIVIRSENKDIIYPIKKVSNDYASDDLLQ